MENLENNENFTLLYSEEIDAWILQIDDEHDEKTGQLKGIIIYLGDNKPKKEQENELIDLILKNDNKRLYYEEIIKIISNPDLDF